MHNLTPWHEEDASEGSFEAVLREDGDWENSTEQQLTQTHGVKMAWQLFT